jgi:hypothetical protein
VTRLPTRRFRLDQIESNFRRTLDAFESGEPGSVPATLDSPLVRAYVRHSGKDFQTLLRSVGKKRVLREYFVFANISFSRKSSYKFHFCENRKTLSVLGEDFKFINNFYAAAPTLARSCTYFRKN